MVQPLDYTTAIAPRSRPILAGAILGAVGLLLIALAGGFLVLVERVYASTFSNISAFDTTAVIQAKLTAQAGSWQRTFHVSLLYACALGCLCASVIMLVLAVRKLRGA